MTRTEVKELLKEKFHPSKINNGASSYVNTVINSLLSNPMFDDKYLTDDFVEGIDDYLANKSLFVFDLNFDDDDGYQLALGAWVEKHLEDSGVFGKNPRLMELMLKTFVGGIEVTYATYDENDDIVVKKIKANHNSALYDNIAKKVKDAIANNDYTEIFESSFLSEIVRRGYTYEGFKKRLSEEMAKGLKDGSLVATITLSKDFLGITERKDGLNKEYGDGPLKFVYNSPNNGDVRLNKEFPSLGISNKTTISTSKISKFEELSNWNVYASTFGKVGLSSNDSGDDPDDARGFSDEQIDQFANAIVGKDLSKNEFNYYTGEIYDEWGSAFDSDYWAIVASNFAENLRLTYAFAWDTAFGGTLSTAGTLGAITVIQSQWAIASLAASIDASISAAFLSLSGASAVTSAPIKLSRFAKMLNAGSKIIKIVDPRIWTALGVATIAAFGYSMWESEEVSHKQRMEKRLLSQYMSFLTEAITSLLEGKGIGDTFRSTAADNTFLREILAIFAIDKEVERRLRVWNRLSFELRQNEDFLDDSNKDNIDKAVNEAISGAFKDIPLPELSELTEEQIEDRQRFYKQAALMMNLPIFAGKYENHIIDRQNGLKPDGPNKLKPFGGRFWRATSKNKEKLINNLFSSDKSQYLLEVPTHIMTQLTPKFRLYKVLNDSRGKLRRTEFVFPMHTDLSRKKNFSPLQSFRDKTQVEQTIKPFLSAQFDKGDGVGLKSFTLEFNGTNPAEARNDVKGSMTLFFQSFADFVRERISYNGEKFSFVDLIVQPKQDDDERVQGIKTQTIRQYDPSFYRIMVETGYSVPDTIEGATDAELSDLKSAIKNMNKSFYLCMVDHDFSIKNDGTVEVKLTYRAYIETALKSLKFDALTTPELAKQRIENETKLFDLSKSEKCTKDQLRDVQVLIASIEEDIIKNSLNSIVRRLFDGDKIFTCEIDNDDRKEFLNKGYFRKCDITASTAFDLNSANANSGDLGIVLNTRLPENSADFNFHDSDENDTTIQFFFFGDLLYTILDALYSEDDRSRSRGLTNTMIVLGSFDFSVFQKEQAAVGSDGYPNSFNIANIPISVEFFSRWFVDNVLSQKSTRRTFPILNFIRSLSNALVSNALLEASVNRDIEQRLIFQTGQFSSYSQTGINIFEHLIHNTYGRTVLDTDSQRGIALPLEGSPQGDSKIENFFHYIILNPNGSTKSHDGVGDYELDIGSGVFHVEIGSNRGLVKTVNFSKTDMQYIREARFMRNGIDGLLQLSSVYDVSIEMFGNTLFYPGMDLWLNPYGFGGTALGSPADGLSQGKRSLANILGLGGYHTITSVTVNLSPGSFTTNIRAQHYYSGDKEDIDKPKGISLSTNDQLIEDGVLEDNQSTPDAAFCKSEIVDLQNFMGDGVPFDTANYIEEMSALQNRSTEDE